jgi:hypothetical protein
LRRGRGRGGRGFQTMVFINLSTGRESAGRMSNRARTGLSATQPGTRCGRCSRKT